MRGVILASVLLLVPAAMSTAAEVKIGFVNVAKVLEQAPQATEASAKLEKEFASRDQDLLAAQRLLRKMEDQLLNEGAEMSAEERLALEQDIRLRKRDIKRELDEFREDLNLRKNQELAAVQRLVLEAIQSLARQEDYDLVLTDGVVYAGERVDITGRVLDRLKPASGPAAARE